MGRDIVEQHAGIAAALPKKGEDVDGENAIIVVGEEMKRENEAGVVGCEV